MKISSILPLKKAVLLIGGEKAIYKLTEYTEHGNEYYFVTVEYQSNHSACFLNCEHIWEAEKLFRLLVHTKTTPLSLSDTIYELYR